MSAKFSASRKRAFLTYLAQTGNQTLSAEKARVSRSWVCLHRSNDPEFDAACREAIERAKRALRDAAKAAPQDERIGGWRYLGGHELVVSGTNGVRTQVRRARLLQWTPRVERRFLAALAATCNVKAAAQEVGLWPPSAYNHRNRWPAFAKAWDEAIEEGYVRIEAALVEAGGHNPYSKLDDVPVAEMPAMCSCERAPHAPSCAIPPDVRLASMTIDQKIHLLHMHKHQVRTIGKAPGLPPRIATPEEAGAELEKALRRVESWMKREAARKMKGLKRKGAVTE